ncbi:Late embryogenesis abundant (LEA) hydroxyproline-rich glycoprotein family [Euphorbia peplus]|nr:Late embryogenesis abundant (LEA) hydroxyproline-rich glycoprotein family [Euphorbia peplus]
MSQILIESPKHCAIKGRRSVNIDHKLYKKLFFIFSSVFTTILSLIFIIWIILRPAKPEFSLKEANIYQLNLSGPNLLNSSIELTLLSKNPNQKVGIYYDDLQAYASYKGQQITVDTYLPPFYQGHEDSNLLTASLIGTSLPVASSIGYQVGRDQSGGKLVLILKLNGRLRWKVGTWVSGRYRVNVNCVALLAFQPNFEPLTSNLGTRCSTTI